MTTETYSGPAPNMPKSYEIDVQRVGVREPRWRWRYRSTQSVRRWTKFSNAANAELEAKRAIIATFAPNTIRRDDDAGY